MIDMHMAVKSPLTSCRFVEAAMIGRRAVEDKWLPFHLADKLVDLVGATMGTCRLRKATSRVYGESSDHSPRAIRPHRHRPSFRSRLWMQDWPRSGDNYDCRETLHSIGTV